MRGVRRATAAAAAALALAGCGSSESDRGGTSAERGSTGTPSTGSESAAATQTTAATEDAAGAQDVTVDLTFTGALSGHLTTAHTGPKFACGTPTFPDMFVLQDLQGELGGQTWAYGITISSYDGPGPATGNVVVNLTDPTNPSNGYINKEIATTKVVVNPDGKSGTSQVDLYKNVSDEKPALTVTGTWRCP